MLVFTGQILTPPTRCPVSMKSQDLGVQAIVVVLFEEYGRVR